MAVLLEEMMKSLELWMGLIRKTQTIIDHTLDPVLLVPGIAGSILNAVNHKTGRSERIWVRILGADHEFCDKLWSRFDPSTGQAVNLDPDTSIEVPEDRYGLYAIDSLDPDMIIGCDSVYYFHDMIVEMLKWGYQEGTSLFGFGYDFRQSNRFHETLERLAVKLESVYTASGGKKINIISHSMGGLLVKCFMTLHSNIFEKYVKNWIAIASPFQGAPGYITSTFFNGMSFLEGWEQNFFISKWSMHQLLIECPSIYELMGAPDFNWEHIPLLEVWRERRNSDGDSSAILESYPPVQAVSILKEALENNKVTYGGADVALPFNVEILNWANETRNVLNRAKLPSQVKFFNVYGTGYDTPHSVSYGSGDKPISDLKQLPFVTPKYIYVDGDGTVPTESAKADGLNAEARVGVPGDHRGILCDRHVFRIVKHWLKADHDPFYNPVNDYVILPTLFDYMERHREEGGLQSTSFKDEWEIIPENEIDGEEERAVADEKIASLGPVFVSRVGDDRTPREEATAAAAAAAAHAAVGVLHSTLDSCRAELINSMSVSTNA